MSFVRSKTNDDEAPGVGDPGTARSASLPTPSARTASLPGRLDQNQNPIRKGEIFIFKMSFVFHVNHILF